MAQGNFGRGQCHGRVGTSDSSATASMTSPADAWVGPQHERCRRLGQRQHLITGSLITVGNRVLDLVHIVDTRVAGHTQSCSASRCTSHSGGWLERTLTEKSIMPVMTGMITVIARRCEANCRTVVQTRYQ